jgi:hypothetical protein
MKITADHGSYPASGDDTDFAHKGYLVRFNRVHRSIWIEKNGVFCGWMLSVNDALKTIDLLAEGPRF